MSTSRVSNERGMALAVAIFALVVIGALVAGTFFAGRLEQSSGQATVYASQAAEAAEAGLTDAIVHGLDIRRPLHREHPIPPSAFGQVARFLISTRWPATLVMGGNPRRRIDGLRLVVDDLGWSHGHGPEVHGTSETMMLVLSGRPVRPDEVSGPGAELLRARL